MSKLINLISFKQTYHEAQLHPYIRENFVTEDGFLKINLRDDKLFPMTDFIIKMRYFDILAFIYNIGGGKVFNQQLMSYIQISKNVSKSRAKNIIEELIYYHLVSKRQAWNNKMVDLKTQVFQFFGNPKATQTYTIASVIKRTFIVEHHLQFDLNRREFYMDFLDKNGLLTKEQLKELEFRKFMLVEKITQTANGKLHVHFGFLNYQDSLNTNVIVSRIESLNTLLKVNETDIHFSVNVCNYNKDTTNIFSKKWENQNQMVMAKYRNLENVTFTNLNINRYFSTNDYKLEEDKNNDNR